MSNTTDGETSVPDPEEIGYAQAVAEIDEILAELGEDGIDIDVLSAKVARAAALIAVCRERIGAAQEQVAAIVEGIDVGNDEASE